jgi:excinuclease ABC subunit B
MTLEEGESPEGKSVVRLLDKAAQAKRVLRTGAGSGHGKSVWTAAESADAVANLDLLDAATRVDEIKEVAGNYFTTIEEIPKALKKIEAEMKEAARAMQFERAAELRDQIKRLRVLCLGL